MTTWGELHAGDVVIGEDGKAWGVTDIGHGAVTLVNGAAAVTGRPDPAAPVSVIRPSDTQLEAAAWQMLDAAGLQPEIIRETWER